MTTLATVGPSLPSNRMRRALLIPLLVVVAGCGGATSGGGAAPARPAKASSNDPPPADAPLPHTTRGIADALTGTTRQLESYVRDWLRSDPLPSTRPPPAIDLAALYQQRIYRHLRRHPALAEAVIAAMPARMRLQARDNFAAGRSLLRLAPKTPPKT